MPPKIGPRFQVNFAPETLKRIEEISEKHDMKRSEVIRIMVDLGLDVYEYYKILGVPQLADFYKRIKKAVKDGIQPRLL